MRSFVIILAVAIISVQGLTDEQKEKIQGYRTQCIAETNVDKALIEKAYKGDFSDDAKFKDHLFCFSKKAGFQNDAGEIQESVVLTKLTAETKDATVAKTLFDKCNAKKATPQETVLEVVKCLYKNSPTHISIA